MPSDPTAKAARTGCPALDFDHHAITFGNRFAEWERVRAQGPVVWSTRYDGFWAVSGYAEATAVLLDAQTFSSQRRADGRGGQAIPSFLWPRPNVPGEYDGAEHARLRRGFTDHLSPTTVNRRRLEIEAIISAIFAGLEGRAEIDAAREIALLVPARVVLTFMGADVADAEWMGALAPGILTAGSADAARAEELRADLQRIENRMLEQVAQRRANPRDDVITAYAQLRDDNGNLLGDDDLLSVLVNSFLFGGLITAAEVIANAIVELGCDLPLRQRLIDAPSLIPHFVSEMTRTVTPAGTVARTATRDVELGGQMIRAGERVLVMLAAANFDEAVFPQAGHIDPARSNKRHLAFGLGAHFCPGSPLARLEIELTIRELLQRMPAFVLLNPEVAALGVTTNAQGWNAIRIAPR